MKVFDITQEAMTKLICEGAKGKKKLFSQLHFLGFCLSFIVLWSILVHVKGQKSTPKGEDSASTMSETPGLESSLYFHNVCVSLCNRYRRNIYFYMFIIDSSQSVDIQLLLLWPRYFRSHYFSCATLNKRLSRDRESHSVVKRECTR